MKHRTPLTTLVIALITLALSSTVLAGSPRHFKRGGGVQPELTWGVGARIGLFTPDGESVFWNDTFDVFTGDIDDFEDTSLAFDFHYHVNRVVRVNASVFGYQGETSQGYVDADIDPFLRGVRHDTEFELAGFTVGGQLMLFGSAQRVRPYLGLGGGFYSWRYREVGEFVLFDEFDPAFDEIIFADYLDDGVTLGYYLNAGVEFVLNPNWSLVVDGRWHRAEDDLSGDFEGFGDIDLSGRELSLGVAWRF